MEHGETETMSSQLLASDGWEPVELYSLTLDGGYARARRIDSLPSPWQQTGETLLMFDKDQPRSCIKIEVNWSVSEMLSFSIKDSGNNRESWYEYATEHLRATGNNRIPTQKR